MEHHLAIQMVLHIFFNKPFCIRNYSANTVGSTRCKRYYYPIDIKLLYLRPQIPDLSP